MSDASWVSGAVAAIVRHPQLWGVALVQMVRLAAPGWWRRRPFLPLPAPGYLRLRVVTMYGGDGSASIDPDDLVTWLRWCRSVARR